MPRRLLLPVTVAMTALVVCGACSSKSPATTATQPTGTAGTTSAAASTSAAVTTAPPTATSASGACAYVSAAQASQLAGSPVKPGVARSVPAGPVTFDYCDFIFDPGNAPGVTVAVASLGGNGASLFGQFRASEQNQSDYQVVGGVGDEAFYSNGNLNVRHGNTGLILFVGRNNGAPRGTRGIPDEKQLAALILGKL